MKLAACFLLLAASAATPEPQYFQYSRPVLGSPAVSSQTCLTLDATVFQHASERLADLRLYRGTTETPYTVRLPAPVQPATTPISPLNLGVQGKQTTFDVALPEGRYADLDLGVEAQDFIATVTITGSHTHPGGPETSLGQYTIFDLTRQRLGRSTVLHLPASDFRYLHFVIAGPVTPGNITGVTVERFAASREMYQPVAQSAQPSQKNHTTVFELAVPAHVPVDRVLFAPVSIPPMFSRDVRIAVQPAPQRPVTDEVELPLEPSIFTGNLLRLHTTRDGRRIDEERQAIDTPSASFDTPTKWTITIENGDDAPLSIASIQLQMLQRDLCFDAAANQPYSLYYGDSALSTPVYDYATLFTPSATAARASLGPEQPNPLYKPRPDRRPFTEKHPTLLWAALIAVIGLLGTIALRSSSRASRSARPPTTP